jgi:hypothetical protein
MTAAQAAHQVIWLSDECLRCAAHGGHAGARGFHRDGDKRRADADLVILNTCHIREKASEKVYSELGRLREAKDDKAPQRPRDEDRRRRLRRAGRRRGDRPPRTGGRCRGRPAELSSSARPAAQGRARRPRDRDRISRSRTSFPRCRRRSRRRSARAAFPPSSRFRKAATNSAPSASCPIRAARKPRGRSRASPTTCAASPTTACARSR